MVSNWNIVCFIFYDKHISFTSGSMFSKLCRRIQRRTLSNFQTFVRQKQKQTIVTPNQIYSNTFYRYSLVINQLENTLLNILKRRNSGFSFKTFAVPFVGSLALIGIKANCSGNFDANRKKCIIQWEH